MAGEGYSIIPISGEHQLAYGCNVLNLGGSRIISVHAASARQIVKHPGFKGDVRVIDFSSITRWAPRGGVRARALRGGGCE
jgi:N-dimethylarginine dimethylaminohydrolase